MKEKPFKTFVKKIDYYFHIFKLLIIGENVIIGEEVINEDESIDSDFMSRIRDLEKLYTIKGYLDDLNYTQFMYIQQTNMLEYHTGVDYREDHILDYNIENYITDFLKVWGCLKYYGVFRFCPHGFAKALKSLNDDFEEMQKSIFGKILYCSLQDAYNKHNQDINHLIFDTEKQHV